MENLDIFIGMDLIKIIEMYILLFFTYSFCGWAFESFGSIVNPKVRKFVNRGFLIGPYCPVYGTGAVFVTLLLQKYAEDIPVLFFLSLLICGSLEYFTSYIMEKLFNARWWDYKSKKFNINGRVCLEMLIPFGVGATLIVRVLNPFFVSYYKQIPDNILYILLGCLLVIYFIDMIISTVIISSFKNSTYEDIDNTQEISGKVKDKAEEVSEKMKDKAEDAIMKAESDAIVFLRTLKVKELKLQRKVRYTGKKASIAVKKSPEELVKKFNRSREYVNEKIITSKNVIDHKIRDTKETIDLKQKEQINKINQKIQSVKLSSEEFTKQVKDKFRQTSHLRGRLVDAFPDLTINIKVKKNKPKRRNEDENDER